MISDSKHPSLLATIEQKKKKKGWETLIYQSYCLKFTLFIGEKYTHNTHYF